MISLHFSVEATVFFNWVLDDFRKLKSCQKLFLVVGMFVTSQVEEGWIHCLEMTSEESRNVESCRRWRLIYYFKPEKLLIVIPWWANCRTRSSTNTLELSIDRRSLFLRSCLRSCRLDFRLAFFFSRRRSSLETSLGESKWLFELGSVYFWYLG